MGRASKLLNKVRRIVVQHTKTISRRYRKFLGRACVRLSILESEIYLRKNGPITVLIDNSALGHGVTHETAWIDTGQALWGGDIPVSTGHSTRIPVHAPGSTDRTYREVTYLVGIAELAKRGHIKLVTSAELQAEAWRQPIGRFRGYGYFDHYIFEGIPMPSVDGSHFDATDAKAAQQARLSGSAEEPFVALAKLLPAKSNLDAWHIHTAHKHGLFCFLAIDFPLTENFRRASKGKDFPHLNSKLMLPSELAASIKLRPIEPHVISYESSSWFVHPDLHTPDNRRTSPRQGSVHFNISEQSEMTEAKPSPEQPNSGVVIVPSVGEMKGIDFDYGHGGLGIQYLDKSGNWHQLDMTLGDAMFLLSMLKKLQLDLDIPFPDDPRDPSAKAIRPSERSGAFKATPDTDDKV